MRNQRGPRVISGKKLVLGWAVVVLLLAIAARYIGAKALRTIDRRHPANPVGRHEPAIRSSSTA